MFPSPLRVPLHYVCARVARWYIFEPKSQFFECLAIKDEIYLMAIWPILLQFHIFYGHLVCIHIVLYVLWYIFPVLVCCTDKNLAILVCAWRKVFFFADVSQTLTEKSGRGSWRIVCLKKLQLCGVCMDTVPHAKNCLMYFVLTGIDLNYFSCICRKHDKHTCIYLHVHICIHTCYLCYTYMIAN
jgi:hypothetical protein